jgi:AcrR family transcriptional regulator
MASVNRPRGRPRSTDPPAATDKAILDAALDAFSENGFAGTSVRDVARRLEVSHNLLPQRFGTKERLWYAAVDHGFATFGEASRVAPEPGEDELAFLRRLIVRFVEAMAERPALPRIINQEATRPGPRLDHIYEHYIGPSSRAVQAALDHLHAKGKARRVPPAAFYFLITHGAVGPVALAPLAERFGPKLSVHDYAEGVADLIIDGIRTG